MCRNGYFLPTMADQATDEIVSALNLPPVWLLEQTADFPFQAFSGFDSVSTTGQSNVSKVLDLYIMTQSTLV